MKIKFYILQMLRSRLVSLLAVLAIIFLTQHLVVAARSPGLTKAQYQQALTAQVDTDLGAPRDGRNPATQQQASLSSAASLPNGNGSRNNTPAKALSADQHHVNATNVLPNTKKTHVLSSGCMLMPGMPVDKCTSAVK